MSIAALLKLSQWCQRRLDDQPGDVVCARPTTVHPLLASAPPHPRALRRNRCLSHSRRRRILLKINDLSHSTFVNIKPIESTIYAFYAVRNAASFELSY